MAGLAQTRIRAQQLANIEGKPLAILNLNMVGAPLYVIRQPWPECEKARDFVEMVQPQAPNENA